VRDVTGNQTARCSHRARNVCHSIGVACNIRGTSPKSLVRWPSRLPVPNPVDPPVGRGEVCTERRAHALWAACKPRD